MAHGGALQAEVVKGRQAALRVGFPCSPWAAPTSPGQALTPARRKPRDVLSRSPPRQRQGFAGAGLESSKVIPTWPLLGPHVTQEQRTRGMSPFWASCFQNQAQTRFLLAVSLLSSYFLSTAEYPLNHSALGGSLLSLCHGGPASCDVLVRPPVPDAHPLSSQRRCLDPGP